MMRIREIEISKPTITQSKKIKMKLDPQILVFSIYRC